MSLDKVLPMLGLTGASRPTEGGGAVCHSPTLAHRRPLIRHGLWPCHLLPKEKAGRLFGDVCVICSFGARKNRPLGRFSDCQKSIADFAPAGANHCNKFLTACTSEISLLRLRSVRIVRQRRTIRARSRLQSCCQKTAEPFFDRRKKNPPPRGWILLRAIFSRLCHSPPCSPVCPPVSSSVCVSPPSDGIDSPPMKLPNSSHQVEGSSGSGITIMGLVCIT